MLVAALSKNKLPYRVKSSQCGSRSGAVCSMQGTDDDGQSSWIKLAVPGRVIWPFELKTNNNSRSSCFVVVRLTRCAVWIHWTTLWRLSSSLMIHVGNSCSAALSSSLIDARSLGRSESHRPFFVMWLFCGRPGTKAATAPTAPSLLLETMESIRLEKMTAAVGRRRRSKRHRQPMHRHSRRIG